MKVIKHIDGYKFTGSFFNYLFTITINTCNNYGKKNKLEQCEFDEAYITKSERDNLDQMISVETNNNIKVALNMLPNYQKEAIILKFYYGMKVREIAEIMNTSVPTAQSRINQGLAKMKKIIKKEDFKIE